MIPPTDPEPTGGWLPWGSGYCTRLDWPDETHDFCGWTRSLKRAERRLRRDRAYYQRGPYRPTRLQIVIISKADLSRHPSARCKSQECPP
jgi:hypothetical protein